MKRHLGSSLQEVEGQVYDPSKIYKLISQNYLQLAELKTY